jgi:SSS family solute:Na+ symporter
VLKSDKAYPVLLNLLPTGLKGLSFAALTAAIVASLAGKANSISTIFTLDLYKKYFRKEATEEHLVWVGKLAIVAAMIIAILVAPQLRRFDQAFQFIQDFTGLISPGVVAIFLLGLFWRKANAMAALTAALLTLPLGILFNELLPSLPFLHRMGYVFIILMAVMIVISLIKPKKESEGVIAVDASMFRTNTSFTIISLLVMGILAALYIVFW